MSLGRTALWCGAVFAAFLGVAALAVTAAVYRPDLFRPWVERALTPRGGTASLAALRLSLAPPALELAGLAIAGPPRDGDLLRLDLLRLELIPRGILNGGPWLRHVEAKGLVFERPRTRETTGPPDLTGLTRLFDIEDLTLTGARLRVPLSQGELAADGVRLTLIPEEGGIRRFRGSGKVSFTRMGSAVAEGRISAQGDVVPGPAIEADLALTTARLTAPWLAGHGSGRTRLRVTPKSIRAEELALTIPQARLSLGPQAAWTLGPIRLDAAAGATLTGGEPRLEVRGLDVGGLLLARGRLDGATWEGMSGTLEGEIPRVERVKTFLAPLLPSGLSGMDLTGRLPFALRLSFSGTESVLALELVPRDLVLSWPRGGLGCRFRGAVRGEAPFEGWLHGKAALAGRIEGTGHFERPPVVIRRFRFDAPLAGGIAAPAFPGATFSVGAGDVTYEGRSLPLGALELTGSARPADRSYRVEELEIRSDSIGRLTGELAYHAGSLRGRLDGAGLPADNLVSLAHALAGREWDGWSTTGTIDLAARLEPVRAGSRIAVTATLGNVGFSSPAGDAMGQNLAGRADLEALLAPKPRMKADLFLRRGEALWGTVYVDLSSAPLDLHAGGTRSGPDEYADLVLEGGLAGFGRLRVEGTARRAGGTWRHEGRLRVRGARLGPIFRTFARDPLAASHPDLAGLEMDGAAEAAVSFSGSGREADLAGTLRLRSGEIRRGAGPPLLAGLAIDLPIRYALGSADPGLPGPSDAASWGRLRLESLRLAGQELGPLEMPAVLAPNRLYLRGAIDSSLFDAKVHLRDLRVDEPLSPRFRVKLAARLEGLDLARVAGDNSAIEGHVGGLLDPVVVGRQRMTADGALTGDLFGGRLEIRNPTVKHPFGGSREIGADVNVTLVDLERLSAALGVGRITGRLSGSIEGLRVAFGQPVAFHLVMESVSAKGVRQSVSLKAVNSISLVSTGSSLSGLGASLMTKFFKEFPYEKIGFACDLKNDVFTVRGLIHEDGVEYLVKRRAFAGINVINRNPDNRIGFSDMVERAKRATGGRSE